MAVPRAGYALIGRPRLGVATYLIAIVAVLGLGWLVTAPDPVVGWTNLAFLGVAIVLWLSEVFAVRRATIRPAAPSLLVRSYPVAATVGWLVAVGAAVPVFLFIGSYVMAGGGMAPTINEREQFVYHKRVGSDDLHRSRVIAFRTSHLSAWQPGAVVVARIIAVPGDRLAIQDGRYTINGEPGPPAYDASRLKPVILVPLVPASLTVPDGCYFVCQDKPKNSYDSSVLSWVERTNIVSSRLWYLRRGRLLDRIE